MNISTISSGEFYDESRKESASRVRYMFYEYNPSEKARRRKKTNEFVKFFRKIVIFDLKY